MQTSAFDITQAMWNVAAGALGSFVAGFYGVRLGLTKVRGERAFDRRLDWYRSMADSVTSLRNGSVMFEHMVTHGAPKPEIVKMGQDLIELTKAFHDLSNSAELYARPGPNHRTNIDPGSGLGVTSHLPNKRCT